MTKSVAGTVNAFSRALREKNRPLPNIIGNGEILDIYLQVLQ
jgi:hypothetical protein